MQKTTKQISNTKKRTEQKIDKNNAKNKKKESIICSQIKEQRERNEHKIRKVETRCTHIVSKEKKLRAEAINHSQNKLKHIRQMLKQKNEIVCNINSDARKEKNIFKMTVRKEIS